MIDYRYRAFISYSSADDQMASKLLRALEGYRTPRRLVGSAGKWGAVEARIAPLFRDREEFVASSDLGASIRAALDGSEFLLVLCSRASARSEWVNQEIVHFKSLAREGRLLSVIVDGEPGASTAGDPANECFPPALLATVQAGRVPLAADLRAHRDGWALSLEKLRAAILGVDLDELIARNRRRRRQQWAMGLTGTAFLIGVLSYGGLEVVTGRAEKNAQALLADADQALREQRYAEAAMLYGRGIKAAPSRMALDYLYAGFDLLSQLRPAAQIVAELPDPTFFNWRGAGYVKSQGSSRRISDQPLALFKSVGNGSMLVVSDIHGLVRGFDTATLDERWRSQLETRSPACSIEDLGTEIRIGAYWAQGGVTLSAMQYQNLRVQKDGFAISSQSGQIFDADIVCGEPTGRADAEPAMTTAPSAAIAATDLGNEVVELPFPMLAPEAARWQSSKATVGPALRGLERDQALARLPEELSRFARSYNGGPERIDRCGDAVVAIGLSNWGMGGGHVDVCRQTGDAAPVCDAATYGQDFLGGAISPRCDLAVISGDGLILDDNATSGLLAFPLPAFKPGLAHSLAEAPALPITRLSAPAFSPSGDRLVAIGGDSNLYFLQNQRGHLLPAGAHSSVALGEPLLLAWLGEDALAALSDRDGKLALSVVSADLSMQQALPIPGELIEADSVLLSDGQRDLVSRVRTEKDLSIADGGDGKGHGRIQARYEIAVAATADGRFLALVTRSGVQLYAVTQGLPLGQPYLFKTYPAYGGAQRPNSWSNAVQDHIALGHRGNELVLAIGDQTYARRIVELDDARGLLRELQARTGVDPVDGETSVRDLSKLVARSKGE